MFTFKECLKYILTTSWGGTLKTWTFMSTISTMSIQGIMKKTPGPLALPDKSKPSRILTALSYFYLSSVNKNVWDFQKYLDYFNTKQQRERKSNKLG
jgi:hypothetical protein